MLILKAAILHCVIAYGYFPLDKPAQIDPTGCKKIELKWNYIEEVFIGGQVVESGLAWEPLIHANLDNLEVVHNEFVVKEPKGGYPKGYTADGCAAGWHKTLTQDLLLNIGITCVPGVPPPEPDPMVEQCKKHHDMCVLLTGTLVPSGTKGPRPTRCMRLSPVTGKEIASWAPTLRLHMVWPRLWRSYHYLDCE